MCWEQILDVTPMMCSVFVAVNRCSDDGLSLKGWVGDGSGKLHLRVFRDELSMSLSVGTGWRTLWTTPASFSSSWTSSPPSAAASTRRHAHCSSSCSTRRLKPTRSCCSPPTRAPWTSQCRRVRARAPPLCYFGDFGSLTPPLLLCRSAHMVGLHNRGSDRRTRVVREHRRAGCHGWRVSLSVRVRMWRAGVWGRDFLSLKA